MKREAESRPDLPAPEARRKATSPLLKAILLVWLGLAVGLVFIGYLTRQ